MKQTKSKTMSWRIVVECGECHELLEKDEDYESWSFCPFCGTKVEL